MESNFNQKRLLVIGDGSIFDEGVTQLLEQDTKMLVSHLIYSADLAFLNVFRTSPPAGLHFGMRVSVVGYGTHPQFSFLTPDRDGIASCCYKTLLYSD